LAQGAVLVTKMFTNLFLLHVAKKVPLCRYSMVGGMVWAFQNKSLKEVIRWALLVVQQNDE
jgi:hypothetical protein